MASRSADLIHTWYFTLMETCRATYWQRYDLFGGRHVAASPSPLERLAPTSTATSADGSLA